MSDRFSKNFSERLEYYGIQEPSQESVSIDEETIWDDHRSPFEVKIIRTNDLDEIKRLIGNDDRHYTEKALEHPPEMNLAMALKEVTPDTVRLAASAYVFGNSQHLKHMKGAIEDNIGSATIQLAALNDLTINQKLVIKPGDVKKIEADRVIFEGKGQIICEGALTLSATTLINRT